MNFPTFFLLFALLLSILLFDFSHFGFDIWYLSKCASFPYDQLINPIISSLSAMDFHEFSFSVQTSNDKKWTFQ